VEIEEMTLASQRLGGLVPAATNAHTIEAMLEVVFSMLSVPWKVLSKQ
jgi:hypothetical protein